MTPKATGGILDAVRSVHLIGVCGAGMEPIARALNHLGHSVSGSDPALDKGRKLSEAGIMHFAEHSASNVDRADIVVYSSAIADTNPEMARARELGLTILHRSEMLAELLSLRETILVAGTHGKTTTTAMTALMLESSGLDPWAFVGGSVPQFGGNLRIGGERLAVAEADESDGSFLALPAGHIILTNIEAEHLNYWLTSERLMAGFARFVAKVECGGSLVACVDDKGVRELLDAVKPSAVTYSVEGRAANFQARAVSLGGSGSQFEAWHRGSQIARVVVGVPGMQNVANALGSLAMAVSLGAEPQTAATALASFRGVGRRFTHYPCPNGCLVIDDYAHHPTEIRATVAAARTLREERGGRLIGVLQPHRYSRTQCFFEEFGPSLTGADHVIVTDVYAAGEEPLDGVSGLSLSGRLRDQLPCTVEYIGPFDDIRRSLAAGTSERDIVLLLGAGSITKLAQQLSAPGVEFNPSLGGRRR